MHILNKYFLVIRHEYENTKNKKKQDMNKYNVSI